MKKYLKKHVLGLAALSGLVAASAAQAQYIVYDPTNDTNQKIQIGIETAHLGVDMFNAGVNTVNMGANIKNAAVNTVSMALLMKLKMIAQSIDKHAAQIESDTTNINNYTIQNFETSNSYKWITNNYYGDDFTCPPDAGPDECDGSINASVDASYAKLIDQASLKDYVDSYKDAREYNGSIASQGNLADIGVKASANKKLANDALATTLSTQRGAIKRQSSAINALMNQNNSAQQGHAHQLQLANALASAQTVQLQEMRSLMLAQANAQAAEAQAKADKESRELAASKGLRRNLGKAQAAKNTVTASKEQY